MKIVKGILVGILLVGMSISYAQDTNSDNHLVSIVIPEIALLDIEPQGSKDISISLDAPTEAGDAFADKTDNSLWLNVTSIVSFGDTRNIAVAIDGALDGVDLKVEAASYSGSGFGSWGTPQPEVTLSTSSQNLVTGLKSGYTVNGSNNGYNLTYTVSPIAGASFGDLEAASSDIQVTYTLSP